VSNTLDTHRYPGRHLRWAYLEDGGITRSRPEVTGFGETKPIATNDTDDGRAQNRRVELSVIP